MVLKQSEIIPSKYDCLRPDRYYVRFWLKYMTNLIEFNLKKKKLTLKSPRLPFPTDPLLSMFLLHLQTSQENTQNIKCPKIFNSENYLNNIWMNECMYVCM